MLKLHAHGAYRIKVTCSNCKKDGTYLIPYETTVKKYFKKITCANCHCAMKIENIQAVKENA